MKHLYRSNQHKVVCGVAGGLAEYFQIDPVIPRILFVVTSFSGGVGILIYIIMWIIVPSKSLYANDYAKFTKRQGQRTYASPDGDEIYEEPPVGSFGTEDNRANSTKLFFGITLLAIGLFMLMEELIPSFNFAFAAPIGLIFLGTYVLLSSKKKAD